MAVGSTALKQHDHSHCNHDRTRGMYLVKANAVLRFDPTHTTMLRKRFAADMTRRFNALKKAIRISVVDNDCFGLEMSLRLVGLAALPSKAFAFKTDAEKVQGFMDWLNAEEELTIFEGPARRAVGDVRWTDTYIESAYKRGMKRGDDELIKAGLLPEPRPGDLPRRIDAMFNLPIHADRVGLLYTRTFSELKGIDDAMDQQISRVLSQGIAEGRGPAYLARQINNRVDKIGITRAKTLARTEIIRAHHQATINMYREAGLEGVRVRAEWSTSGFNVCPDCADLEGRIFSLDEIEGLIPLHPVCRCISIPAGVGEKPSATTAEERRDIVGEQYERADGTIRRRKFYEEITGKKKRPPRARVAPSVPEALPLVKDPSSVLLTKGASEFVDEAVKHKTSVRQVATELERVRKNFPGVATTLGQKTNKFKLTMLDSEYIKHPAIGTIPPASKGPVGEYFKKRITLATGGKTTRPILTPGGFTGDGNDIAYAFRHELGHHLAVSTKTGRKFQGWHIDNYLGDRSDLGLKGKKFADWFRKHVSEYAGVNQHEAFAEVFAIYTSPKYKIGMLPKALEDFMVQLKVTKAAKGAKAVKGAFPLRAPKIPKRKLPKKFKHSKTEIDDMLKQAKKYEYTKGQRKLMEQFAKAGARQPDEAVDAMMDYAHGYASSINEVLRKGKKLKGRYADWVSGVDEFLTYSKPVGAKAKTLYRGISFTNKKKAKTFVSKLRVGKKVTDKGFGSATFSKSTARNFADVEMEKWQSVVFEIRGAQNFGVKTTRAVSEWAESEVLLPRNAAYIVDSIEEGRKGVLNVGLRFIGAK